MKKSIKRNLYIFLLAFIGIPLSFILMFAIGSWLYDSFPIIEHIIEWGSVITVILLAIGFVGFVCWGFAEDIVDTVSEQMNSKRKK